jgi:xeroderma pigmentosum group C-complementing protein
MSRDWNLSSDEEDTFDDWAKVDLNASEVGTSTSFVQSANDDCDSSSSEDQEHHQSSSSQFAGVAFAPSEEEDYEEEDNVDWEDVDQSEEEDSADPKGSQKLATDTENAASVVVPKLRPVTLKLGQAPNNKSGKTMKKRVSRKRYRFEQLTSDLQFLLSNLEKAHLLSLTATAMMVSNYCSSEEALGFAHSLIPLAWIQNPTSAPTLQDLRSFCSFFFHLVHPGMYQSADSLGRRSRSWKGKSKKATALSRNRDLSSVDGQQAIKYRIEEYASFLATRSQAIGLNSRLVQGDYHHYDHVQLFIAMTRSLGWRTRFVVALEPCQRDLDPDHSLFVAMSTRNIFQRLWKEGDKGDSKRPAKRLRLETAPTDQKLPARGDDTMPRSPIIDQKLPARGYDSTPSLPTLFDPPSRKSELPLCWVEVLSLASANKKKASAPKLQWVHVDPTRQLISAPDSVEVALHARHEGIAFGKTKKKRPIRYALAAEHLSTSNKNGVQMRLSDVTPRYSSSFVDSLKARGVVRGKQGPLRDELRADKWWVAVLKSMNLASHAPRLGRCNEGKSRSEAIPLDQDSDDESVGKPGAYDAGTEEVDKQEKKQLQEAMSNEPIPTSKTAFKTNPVYTLPSLLNSNEVLKPDANRRICGIFKGEFVIRRSEVETALAANRWLYRGRKVKETELSKPIKRVKARSQSNAKSFQALKSYGVGQSNDGTEETRNKIIDDASKALPDGMENLYASWQTDPWSPSPVGPNDPLPANEYNNIELALLNPGLVHIDRRHVAKVAKQLGVPYVPCLLGFEGNGGNRTPTIRGIVVHQHNEEMLREASEEMASHFLQEEHENRQHAILLRWKRLMVGVLTKQRVDQAYG